MAVVEKRFLSRRGDPDGIDMVGPDGEVETISAAVDGIVRACGDELSKPKTKRDMASGVLVEQDHAEGAARRIRATAPS